MSNNNDLHAGEREVKKALEEVQVRNVTAIADFTQKSRAMVLDQDKKIDSLNSQVQAQAALLNEFRTQLAFLQTKVFSGGSV
jgi:hypothetical protein